MPSTPIGVGAVVLNALALQLKVGVGVVALELANVCVGRAGNDDTVRALCVGVVGQSGQTAKKKVSASEKR